MSSTVVTASAIGSALRESTVGAVESKTGIAVLVTYDAVAKKASLASEGDTDAFMAYATIHDSNTEGLLIKFGNETRLLGLDHSTPITYVPQSVLLANTDTLLGDVKWVSTCQHTHDQDITGVPVDWFIRVMKPGATSFSGICKPCASDTNCACLATTKDVGTVIFRKVTARTGGCKEKRDAVKAEAKAAAAAKKAAKDQASKAEAAARLVAAAEAEVPAAKVTPAPKKARAPRAAKTA